MIEGYYDQRGRPRVRATISFPNSPLQAPVNFLISTAAAATAIPESAARDLGQTQQKGPTQEVILLGATLPCRRQWLALHFTNHTNGNIERHVCAAIAPDQSWPEVTPPVLGRDLLQDMQVTFHPARGQVLLYPNTDPDRRD